MNLQFPIVQVLKDKLIYGVAKEQQFKRASLSLIDVFNDSIIIDSNGIFYEIKNAIRIGWATPFWGFHPFIKGRLIKIDFNIRSTNQLTLDGLKNILIDTVDQRYSTKFYFFSSKEKLIKRISNASSFKEIIELFIYDTND